MTHDPMDEEYPLILPDIHPEEEWNREMRWRFQEILPRLFLGPLSMQKSVQELINKADITHMLCVLNTPECQLYKAKIDRLCGTRIESKFIPVANPDNIINCLISSNTYISESLRHGGRVAICCSDGMINGPSFLIAYIMATYGCDYDKAFSVVLLRRGCIIPMEAQLMTFYQHTTAEAPPTLEMGRVPKRPDPPCNEEELCTPQVKRMAISDNPFTSAASRCIQKYSAAP